MRIFFIGGTGLISSACSELAIERDHDPAMLGSLIGDKAQSTVFDNSKIKSFVRDFDATTSWSAGVRRSLAWFAADPSRRSIDADANRLWDAILAGYERAFPSGHSPG
jgi:hypothetical protein